MVIVPTTDANQMKLKDLIAPNQTDVKAREMKYPLIMDKKNRSIGKRTKVSAQKVVVRDSKTGVVYGRRSIIQK